MNIPLKEQLKDWKKDHAEMKQCRKPQKRKQERLSNSEWKDIMGINMRVHTRVGGRVRQK